MSRSRNESGRDIVIAQHTSAVLTAVQAAVAVNASLSAVLDALCERLGSELDSDVAVLEPRGDGLRVLNGVGLRPLEWRDLDTTPDFVRHTTDRHRAAAITDTDAFRTCLGMLPLGRHLSVLVASFPHTESLIVVLGRDAAFTGTDAAHVLRRVDEQQSRVRSALGLRTAAQLLAPFAG